MFFDTTSLFFTGNGGDTLGQYGKSKDHRSDCKQMVLGMVIDGDGIPVCSEMWPGNTTDVTTLDQVAQRLQSRFGVRRVCLVADAGMISKKMIAAVEARGWFYILGARLRRTKIKPRKVVLFHEGRGSQEGIFSELKTHCQMDYVPVKTRVGNQLYMFAGILAHTSLVNSRSDSTLAPVARRQNAPRCGASARLRPFAALSSNAPGASFAQPVS